MKNLGGALRIDLRRAFGSFAFYIAIALLIILNYISISAEAMVINGSVMYFMLLFAFDGSFCIIATFIGVIPFGQSFCADWKNQFIRPSLIRCSPLSYAWSKVISVALTAFLSIFIGYLLTAVLFSLRLPMFDAEFYHAGYELYDSGALGKLMEISPWLYLGARIALYGAACAFWAVFTLFVSSFVTNVFATFAAPVIGYYFVVNLPLPIYLRFNVLSGGRLVAGGTVTSFLYALFFFFTLTVIFGWLFCFRVRRRLANG